MDLSRILKEEEGDKSQAVLELNIRIAQKLESPEENIVKVLSPIELQIFLICRINVYVCNGGYEHYFYYSGTHAEETAEAISKVGLDQLHTNYLAAVKVFKNGYVPEDDSERQELIDDFTENQRETLDKLSDQYYCIGHLEALFEYAADNQTDIRV
jgi:hypothetical protein